MLNFHEQVETDTLFEDARGKALEVLKQEAINPDEFVRTYGQERIARDKARLLELERDMREGETSDESEARKLAMVLEVIIHVCGGKAHWFGDNVHMIKTSDFDDKVNHVDEIFEFREGAMKSFLALGVDVTFSRDFEEKLNNIRRDISRGKLAKIDYFKDEGIDFCGELNNVPRVVVALGRQRLQELTELWLEGKDSELTRHPAQFQILAEIMKQCEVFARFAIKKNQPEIAEKYDHIKQIITEILEKKAATLKNRARLDTVGVELIQALKVFEAA